MFVNVFHRIRDNCALPRTTAAYIMTHTARMAVPRRSRFHQTHDYAISLIANYEIVRYDVTNVVNALHVKLKLRVQRQRHSRHSYHNALAMDDQRDAHHAYERHRMTHHIKQAAMTYMCVSV